MDRAIWHHVEDCLPPFDQNVLVLCFESQMPYHQVAWMQSGGTWRIQGSGRQFKDKEVTHWMHLPKMPEGQHRKESA